MKDKLIRYAPFQLYESTSFEEYLAEMSLKGWLIEGIGKNDFLTFRKTEACKRLFTVDIFKEASVSDTSPEGKTADYVELCQAAGWEFLCGRGKMLIFASIAEHPVLIQTDYELKQKMIFKEARKKIAGTLLVFLFCVFLLFLLGGMSFGSLISRYSNIFLLISLFCAALINFLLALDFAVSHISMQAAGRAGRVTEYRGYCMRTKLRVRGILNFICTFGVFAVYLSRYFESDIHINGWIKAAVLVLVLALWTCFYFFVIKKQLKQIQREFIALSAVFLFMGCLYLMPFAANIVKKAMPGVDESGAIHDTGVQAEADTGVSIADWIEFSGIEQQTFLASYRTTRFYYRDTTSGYDVGHTYTIFSSSYEGVLDKYIELAKKDSGMKRDDQWTDEWGADAIYVSSANHFSRYLIIYKGTVLELETLDTLSDIQMKQIRARLHPAAVVM